MKSERLKKIEAENKKYEQETPFNFCDRWCDRCSHEKQMRCILYQDELEQKLTCIAHGKDENDQEITEQVMHRQFEDKAKKIRRYVEEQEIDTYFEREEFTANEEFTNQNKLLEDDSLKATAKNYFYKAHEFLKATFGEENECLPELVESFETIACYHTLLAVKLERALSNFDDLEDDENFALHDSVAQFAICQKAIKESINAFRLIKASYSEHKTTITQLITILDNISQRIKKLEESI